MSEEKSVVTTDECKAVTPVNNVTLEELLEDAQGVQLQFDKIKIPTAGGVAYTIVDTESGEEEPQKTFKAVILKARPSNVYFEEEFSGEAAPPTCTSDDGILGIDAEGEQHDCSKCEFNQFGAANNGKGKACQNRINLYLLIVGESVPRIMSLPASAISKYNSLRTQLFVSKRLLSSVVVKVGLEKKKSASGIDYSSPVFSIDCNVNTLDEAVQQSIVDAKALLKCVCNA